MLSIRLTFIYLFEQNILIKRRQSNIHTWRQMTRKKQKVKWMHHGQQLSFDFIAFIFRTKQIGIA